jgi:hypothetical protein
VGSTPGGCDHAGARTDPELGSALDSSWRDPIASLVNTLRVLHGARAEEDPRSDLRVLPPITGQPRDLPFVGGAIITCLDRPLARGPARRLQFSAGGLGERLHPDRVEQLVGRAQLLARVARRLSRRNHSL